MLSPPTIAMQAERKRPWYLVLALLGALAFGTTGAYDGCNKSALYFVSVDPKTAGEGIADEHDRALVVLRAQAELDALDAQKSRGWPIELASLLLGGAVLLCAMRALGGSGGARSALVQLILVQAGVGVASHFLLRDVLDAEFRLVEAKATAEEHAAGLSHDALPISTGTLMRAASTAFLAIRTLGSVLIVVGLTRRKSLAYFDDRAAALEER